VRVRELKRKRNKIGKSESEEDESESESESEGESEDKGLNRYGMCPRKFKHVQSAKNIDFGLT
jgi:hypothetical protein